MYIQLRLSVEQVVVSPTGTSPASICAVTFKSSSDCSAGLMDLLPVDQKTWTVFKSDFGLEQWPVLAVASCAVMPVSSDAVLMH